MGVVSHVFPVVPSLGIDYVNGIGNRSREQYMPY